ncbi:sulfatase-like hydrolase/transferase [Reichenbachiella sp. MALMAid0571]
MVLIFLHEHSLLAQKNDKPNFIFILTDDQSYGMLGCEGNQIVKTPNIDQLAKEGVQFTNAHITSAICTPSRVSILLSQYERKHGVNFNSGTSLSEKAWNYSYPVLMKKAGYYTGWIGKNHAPVGNGGYRSGLMESSFDYWYAAHRHLSFYPKERHDIFSHAIKDTQVEVIEEGVMDFVDNENKLKGAVFFLKNRPKDQPFILSVCFNLPHDAGAGSMELRESDDDIYKTMYRDVEIPLPENYISKKEIKNPKLPTDLLLTENRQNGYDYVDTPEGVRERYIRQLQAMTGIDRMVGNLRKQLKKLHLEENTVLIFTSDHGLFMGQFGLGGKALCYEITTHVPLIVYDPKNHLNNEGKVSDELVQSIDLAPTMFDMANISIPQSFQGKSLYPLIKGKDQKVREFLFTENLWSNQFGNPRCEAVQNKEWKYIRYYRNNNLSLYKKTEVANLLGISVKKIQSTVHDYDIVVYRDYIEASLQGEEPVYEELYNLKNDPSESNNLIKDEQYSIQLREMRQAWKEEIMFARGMGTPEVLRYTTESNNEFEVKK